MRATAQDLAFGSGVVEPTHDVSSDVAHDVVDSGVVDEPFAIAVEADISIAVDDVAGPAHDPVLARGAMFGADQVSLFDVADDIDDDPSDPHHGAADPVDDPTGF